MKDFRKEATHGTSEFYRARVAIRRRPTRRNSGAAVRKRVTQETTMVVVGELQAGVVGADGKSSNLRYAEQLAAKGAPILLVTEDDFRELVRGPRGL